MLFWTFILLFAFGVLGIIYDQLTLEYHDFLKVLSFATAILFGAAVSISLVVMANYYIQADSYVAASKQRYEMLVYQCENDVYDNDNDFGKRELIEDIQHWNEDLAKYKALQNDFWVGIYIPDVYDQFEFISLERKDS